MRGKSLALFFALCAIVGLLAISVPVVGAQEPWKEKVEPALLEEFERLKAQGIGETEFMVEFADRPDLSPAFSMGWEQRGAYVYVVLQGDKAAREQALAKVDLLGQCFLASPYCQMTGDLAEVEATAWMEEVSFVRRPKVVYLDPRKVRPLGVQDIEWNIAKVRADQVWQEFGVTGAGVVVANNDTGVDWTHPALASKYRCRGSGDHSRCWDDPAGVCGGDDPCDNVGHGTHTMGTIVGGEGIGVAPGGQWIACKGCEGWWCSEFSLQACADWVLAPAGDPSYRPQVVNNSWGGWGGNPWYQPAVEAWLASGIFPVFAAGNSGPYCQSGSSPGDYENVLGVGATTPEDGAADFSGRGPSAWGEIKPDVSAPGTNIRSSVPGGGYDYGSGTSMAAPHVAGLAALLFEANPSLTGQFEATRDLIRETSQCLTSPENCGGVSGDSCPNNTFGWGRIDAYEAVMAAGGGNPGRLEGTVRDVKTGVGIAGAAVEADAGTYRLTTETDSTGEYGLNLAEGEYEVRTSAFGYCPVWPVTVTITAGQVTALDFTLKPLPRFTVRGTVYTRREAGGPWFPEEGATIRALKGPEGFQGASTTADVAGQYRFELVEGTYLFRAQTGFCAGNVVEAEIPPPQVVDFYLDKRQSYKIQAVDYQWVDVQTQGERLAISDCDDCSVTLSLVKPITYWGTSVVTLTVSCNGFVQLGEPTAIGSDFVPRRLGEDDFTDRVVAVNWLDLDPRSIAENPHGVYFLDDGDQVVVEWAAFQYRSSYWEHFQVVFDRPTGQFWFNYQNSSGQLFWEVDAQEIGIQGWIPEDAIVHAWDDPPESQSSLKWAHAWRGCHVEGRIFLPIIFKN